MLKNTSFQPPDLQSSTGENTPLTTQFCWGHVEDRSSGGRKFEFLIFLARERFETFWNDQPAIFSTL